MGALACSRNGIHQDGSCFLLHYQTHSYWRLLCMRWSLLFYRRHVFVKPRQGRIPRIRDVPVYKLGDPRMTDLCLLGNNGPLTSPLQKQGTNDFRKICMHASHYSKVLLFHKATLC